jgi:hypothetical protein
MGKHQDEDDEQPTPGEFRLFNLGSKALVAVRAATAGARANRSLRNC